MECSKLLAAVIVFVIVARVELFIYRVGGRSLVVSISLSLTLSVCPLFPASKHDNARRWYASAVHDFKRCFSYGSPPDHHHISHSIIHTQEDKNNEDFSRANNRINSLSRVCGLVESFQFHVLLLWAASVLTSAESDSHLSSNRDDELMTTTTKASNE